MNLKGYLSTAISCLIPVVCGAGSLVAIGTVLRGSSQSESIQGEFSFQDTLIMMGGTALGLPPVIVATGASFSTAGKPGTAPGFVVSLSANVASADFISGMVGGYITGFLALRISKNVKVLDWAKGLMPTVVAPLLTLLVLGLLMTCIIGIPIVAFANWLTNLLQSLGSSSMLILSLVIGTLNIVDLGGLINKTVYTFTLTLSASRVNGSVTALQLVNTSTPVEFGLAHFTAKLLGKNIYGQEQIENLKSAVPMGVLNIIGRIIPIIMNDLVRGIITTATGGVADGIASVVLGADLIVSFGGFLMLPTMTRPRTGPSAIIVSVVVTGVAYALVAKDKTAEGFASENDIDEEETNLADIEIL